MWEICVFKDTCFRGKSSESTPSNTSTSNSRREQVRAQPLFVFTLRNTRAFFAPLSLTCRVAITLAPRFWKPHPTFHQLFSLELRSVSPYIFDWSKDQNFLISRVKLIFWQMTQMNDEFGHVNAQPAGEMKYAQHFDFTNASFYISASPLFPAS